jgi:hypothetical protein
MNTKRVGKGSTQPARLPLGAARVDLALLDRLQADAVLVGAFAEDRPLVATAGFCDWRLNGRLSSLLAGSNFAADAEETLLADTNGRIGPARVLLFGLGSRAKMNAKTFRHQVRRMLVVAKKAKLESLALEPPGLAAGLIPADEALAMTVEVVRKAHPEVRLTFLLPDKASCEALTKKIVESPDLDLVELPG